MLASFHLCVCMCVCVSLYLDLGTVRDGGGGFLCEKSRGSSGVSGVERGLGNVSLCVCLPMNRKAE